MKMLTIKNVKTPDGLVKTVTFESSETHAIDAEGRLTILPACINPNANLSKRGKNWGREALNALKGGVTTILDHPSEKLPCYSAQTLSQKQKSIESALHEAKAPLRYRLFLGPKLENLDDIPKIFEQIAGLSLSGPLLKDPKKWNRLFQIAAQESLIISIAADKQDRKSMMKTYEAAIKLTQEYDTELLIKNVTTKDEVELIKEAKQKELLVFGETTPLCFHPSYFSHPFPHLPDDQKAIIEGLQNQSIELFGTDESSDLMLPLALSAYHENILKLEDIINLSRRNSELIFRLEKNEDAVLVDLERTESVGGDSPLQGISLKGWPVFTILRGKAHRVL